MQGLEADLKRLEAQLEAVLEYTARLERHQLQRLEQVSNQEPPNAELKALHDQLTVAADQVSVTD